MIGLGPLSARLLRSRALPLSSACHRAFSDGAKSGILFNAANAPLQDKGYRPGAPPGELKLSTTVVGTENNTTTAIWDCGRGSFEVLERPNTESGYVLEGGCVITCLVS